MTEKLRMASAPIASTAVPVDRDLALARRKLQALLETPAALEVLGFVYDGTPIPKGRARFGKGGHAFTPKRTRLAEGELVRAFRIAWARRAPLADTVAMVMLFYVPTRQRKDLDNLEKLVMDAGTKARVWLDDSQVKAKTVLMELDVDRPRTVIAIAPCLGTMTKTPLWSALAE